MAVTLKQIAEMAGVSIGTVHRALNNRDRISPDVAERIRKIAEALDYKPNTVAKALSIRNKNLTIGVIIHVEKNAFYSDVIAGINVAAEEIKDFGISIVIRHGSKFDYKAQLRLIDEMLADGINALAIIPINHPEVAEKLDKLHNTGFPVVFLSAFIKDVGRLAYVGGNYKKTGVIAASLFNLVSKGSANILAISPSFQMLGHRVRIEGFQQHIDQYYPHLHLQEIIEMDNDHFKNYQLVKEALERHHDVDYVFCGSSSSIIKAIEEFTDRYGSTLKIISFDSSDSIQRGLESGLVLATITQNPREQGYRAIIILFNYLTKGELPTKQNYYMEEQILLKESMKNIEF